MTAKYIQYKHTLFLLGLMLVLKACGPITSSPSGDKSDGGGGSSSGTQLSGDAKILANLKEHLNLEAKEMGGSGACLFHSLREQITQAELKGVVDGSINLDNYDGQSPDEKVKLLRQIAIFEEKKFLETDNNIANAFIALNAQDKIWALEMAKDWYQEVKNTSPDSTRLWFESNNTSDAGRQKMWQYVIDNRAAYWAKTSNDCNWSGTAEALVFARLLNRPLKMYGDDKASLKNGPSYDAQGVVQPYFSNNLDKPGRPLLVFQVSGGGHYQMLTSAS